MKPHQIKVFADSDVVISSLISNRGAAHFLLHNSQPELAVHIGETQLEELKRVAKQLKLNLKNLESLASKKFKITKLKKLHFDKAEDFITDPNDQHIAAGIIASKPKFFLSYNLKHFRIEKIKADLSVICFTPAQLLQYLRSLN